MRPALGWSGVLAACMLVAGLASLALGQDANWDLQNYHYYNPWAWWNGRIFDWDVAAAQIQTYHNPVLDFPFLAMVTLAWKFVTLPKMPSRERASVTAVFKILRRPAEVVVTDNALRFAKARNRASDNRLVFPALAVT